MKSALFLGVRAIGRQSRPRKEASFAARDGADALRFLMAQPRRRLWQAGERVEASALRLESGQTAARKLRRRNLLSTAGEPFTLAFRHPVTHSGQVRHGNVGMR